MEPSSPEKSDNGRLIDEALAATQNDAHPPDEKDAARRMVANRLLAALASGNLEHLEHAREAFLHQGQDESPVPSNGNTIPPERKLKRKPIAGAWKKQRSSAREKKSSGWLNWKRFAGRQKLLHPSVPASSNYSTLRRRPCGNQSRSI